MNVIENTHRQYPKSTVQAAREFMSLFNLEGRIGKSATGLTMSCILIGHKPTISFTVTDTSITHEVSIIDEDTGTTLIAFAIRLMGTVITTQPYRDALADFIRSDWLTSITDRRVFNTIELRKQDDRVLFVVKGSSESPIYGMCYNTILEH